MKRNVKGQVPAELAAYLASGTEDWKPSYRDLRGAPKDAVHTALLVEQGYVCGYCGRKIAPDRTDSHIEHFRPQTKYDGVKNPDLRLDYQNLLASCGSEHAATLPRTCGAAKGGWFDEELAISPWDAACEGRFVYGATGIVEPKGDQDASAKKMIEVLALDHKELVGSRLAVLADLERAIAAGDISAETAEAEITRWRSMSAEGHHIGFGHAAARYLEEEFA